MVAVVSGWFQGSGGVVSSWLDASVFGDGHHQMKLFLSKNNSPLPVIFWRDDASSGFDSRQQLEEVL